MSFRFARPALGALVTAILLTACIEREGRPLSPCTSVTLEQEVTLDNVDEVDLLFLVDNSFSMSQEQASLITELPRIVDILASGDFDQDGDGPGDGEMNDPDFEPVRSLHIGVITPDMGTGGYPVMSCREPDFGDDGTLLTRGRTDIAGCMASYPPFFTFEPASGSSPADFARDVACVATTGTDGCGFEQQLEAMLKALSPSAPTSWTADGYAPPTFFRSTYGHADLVNDGFIRPNSVLAIIPLTDEEDCSARDPALFDASGPYSASNPNLRCFASPEALHPIDRYVDGLLALRRDRSHLVYAPIVGIPEDLVPAAGESPDWDRLISDDPALRDDRMEERVDPTSGTRLVPSCNVPGRGEAYPPIRMLRVAQRLEEAGVGVTAQSICQESFQGALTRIIDLVRVALNQGCLPRELNLEADGSVSCDVLTVMPDGMGCAAMPGAEPRTNGGGPVVEDGRAVCVVPQVVPSERTEGSPPPGDVGWFYDTFTPEGRASCDQRIAFTVQPPTGATVRLECYQAVPEGSGEVHVGTFCEPGEAGNALCATGGEALTCDPVTRACGVPCSTSADCRGAGLVGFDCDGRAVGDVDPAHHAGDPTPYGYCTNPTCG
ncbi:MAG: hypothetical protein H6719_27240 [Sandaracinaceae bacterium]|nr:hypothetical protein [Sandaracinaceae bacterium]